MLKYHSKFLEPYGVALQSDRYMVRREGENEGPQVTSTAANPTKLRAIDEDSGASEISDSGHIWGQIFDHGRLLNTCLW